MPFGDEPSKTLVCPPYTWPLKTPRHTPSTALHRRRTFWCCKDRQTDLEAEPWKAVASSSFLQRRPKSVVAARTASRSTTSWWTTSVCRRVEAGARCASARRTSATPPPHPAPSTTFSLSLPSSSSSSSVTSGSRPSPRWLNLRCSSHLSRFLFIFVFLRRNLTSLQLTQPRARAVSCAFLNVRRVQFFTFVSSFFLCINPQLLQHNCCCCYSSCNCMHIRASIRDHISSVYAAPFSMRPHSVNTVFVRSIVPDIVHPEICPETQTVSCLSVLKHWSILESSLFAWKGPFINDVTPNEGVLTIYSLDDVICEYPEL